MKKVLLLLAAGVSTLAVAQTESAFVDVDALKLTGDKSSFAAQHIASSGNVTMSTQTQDDCKTVGMYNANDVVKSLNIDGVEYQCPTGIQGSNNPKENLYTEGSQTGSVFVFDVKADGWLYVISKLSYNKNYYVWETPGTNAALMAYTLVAFDAADGTQYSYTLPGGADGEEDYFYSNKKLAEGGAAYTSDSYNRTYVDYAGPDKKHITWEDYESNSTRKDSVDAVLKEAGLTLLAKDAVGSDGKLQTSCVVSGGTLQSAANCVATYTGASTTWKANALGVIAFPVIADYQYNVNACGSKITCDGYVFIKGATSMAKIGSSNAIKNITIDDLDENAPIYNVLGQKVQKGYKGICIQNGKKFIVK